MSDQVPETPVEVTVEVTVPEPVVEPEPTPDVVVVEPEPATVVDEVVVETAIDHEGRIAVIESRLAALEMVAANAATTAEVALDVATAPDPEPEIEVSTPEPEVQEPVQEDISPDNEHWFFKKGWF